MFLPPMPRPACAGGPRHGTASRLTVLATARRRSATLPGAPIFPGWRDPAVRRYPGYRGIRGAEQALRGLVSMVEAAEVGAGRAATHMGPAP
jgi:hypothetical protein